jgi:hypothetical protein
MITGNNPYFDTDGRVHGHYVYCLLCHDEDGPIFAKIGHTSNVVSRLKALITGTPVTPRWMFYVRVWSNTPAKALESRLHAALGLFRTNGEWFRFSSEDRQLINELMAVELQQFRRSGYDLKWQKMPAEPAKYQEHARRCIEDAKHAWHTMPERAKLRAARSLAKDALRGLTV